MSASHHNVTCAAGEWAVSNTFSMTANKVREGISRWSGHGISWLSHSQPVFWLVATWIGTLQCCDAVSKTAAREWKWKL